MTNSGKTLITGSDIYGNEAENVDYALSVVDIATFGCGNFMKLPKTVKTANTVVSKSATGGTIYRTSSTEFNKKDEKKIKIDIMAYIVFCWIYFFFDYYGSFFLREKS